MLLTFLKCVSLFIFFLISVAFLTLLERKILSLIGLRVGPNKVSLNGFLQPFSDALKLANKNSNQILNSSLYGYYLGSVGFFFSSLLIVILIYSEPSPVFVKFSGLFFFLMLSFNSFFSMISGWSTYGKYSLIGSLRMVCQLISYEGPFYFCFLLLFFVCSSFSFYEISFKIPQFFLLYCPLLFFIWFPCFLAELNRTPFDFSEGESELVSGFNIDYGSLGFTFLFLSEYLNMVFFCTLSFMIFFGHFKLYYMALFPFLLVWVRAVLPRFRFDKLMSFCWVFLIPLSTYLFCLLFLFCC